MCLSPGLSNNLKKIRKGQNKGVDDDDDDDDDDDSE